MAALICNCMRNHKDPTDYGNAVKKSVQEIVPTGNRSVGLGKQLVNRLEFLILFHCFLFANGFFDTFFILVKKAQNLAPKSEINFKKSKIPLDKSIKKW